MFGIQFGFVGPQLRARHNSYQIGGLCRAMSINAHRTQQSAEHGAFKQQTESKTRSPATCKSESECTCPKPPSCKSNTGSTQRWSLKAARSSRTPPAWSRPCRGGECGWQALVVVFNGICAGIVLRSRGSILQT